MTLKPYWVVNFLVKVACINRQTVVTTDLVHARSCLIDQATGNVAISFKEKLVHGTYKFWNVTRCTYNAIFLCFISLFDITVVWTVADLQINVEQVIQPLLVRASDKNLLETINGSVSYSSTMPSTSAEGRLGCWPLRGVTCPSPLDQHVTVTVVNSSSSSLLAPCHLYRLTRLISKRRALFTLPQ